VLKDSFAWLKAMPGGAQFNQPFIQPTIQAVSHPVAEAAGKFQ